MEAFLPRSFPFYFIDCFSFIAAMPADDRLVSSKHEKPDTGLSIGSARTQGDAR
jgi:hypothetical protein